MKNETDSTVMITPEYRRFIEDLKARVISARISAARAANRDLILLYWDIGRAIVEKQRLLGWGESVVEMVAADLRRAFPESRSFSADNVWRMRQFFLAYATAGFLGQPVPESPAPAFLKPPPEILGQAVPEIARQAPTPDDRQAISLSLDLLAEVPWGQNLLILKKLTAPAARLWYLLATARFGWTRNVLLNQIKAGAHERAFTDKKAHNFDLALPEHLAEQADEMLKSSYNLEFLGLRRAVKERVPEDRPSIGIILCAEKDDVEVEYALRAKRNPIGVAEYRLQSKLPRNLKGKLPTAKQLADVVRAELPERSGV